MNNTFDVIIVGAGPAGSIAALKMAKAGLKVALLERGRQPGSKNIFGGILHRTPALEELYPALWDEAPLERHVHKKIVSVMTSKSSVSVAFETEDFEQKPYNGFTIMRPVFDNWLAQEAVKAGAKLLCNCTVDNLLRKEGQISGVTVKGREGDLKSSLIIAADGVLSFTAEKAGLRGALLPAQMGLGVKLLMGLPAETINERFGLVKDEGADYAFLGITGKVRGGGFLYTNSESISFGLVVHLDSLKASGQTPYDLINQAMQHSDLKKLLKGAVPLEYSAHLVPEGGMQGIPRLYTGGMLVVGDAAGLCYTNGINLEGLNLAITSGAIAADCAIEAVKDQDFSSQRLAIYKKKLYESFVIKDMQTFSKAVDMLHIDRLFETYPETITNIFQRIYQSDGIPRDKMLKLVRREAARKVKTGQLISDAIKMGRALL